uniref:Tyrosine-protein kinase receptor n=3 Tax=Photinus pyralis TaxID=7054 RepID=A0A1Y1KTZ9_PHOPY
MLRKCLIVIITCCLCFLPLHARLCEEVVVFNTVSEFEPNLRGCTIIIGYLKIVMERAKSHEFQNISFPELTEIRGYLLLYRVYGLTTLGKLFPNLSVIRGTTLLTDYSFVLRDMPHLQEIGLRNLKYIARGSTRIENCPNVCYVDTINWTKIASPSHRLDYFGKNEYCESCPSECNGLCWNENYCQVVADDNCDSECYGCSEPRDPKRCYTCQNYLDGSKCVSRCPRNKILHSAVGYCVTEAECPTVLNGTWWVFQGECVNSCPPYYQQVSAEEGWCSYCGNKCVKSCDGILVDTIEAAQKLVGCTHISSSLSIRVFSKSAADELEESLGMIEEIDGYLKVYRSYPLTSLNFLKKLRVIHGKELDNARHSLIVFENQHLHELWDWDNFTLTIKQGTISFHYNPMLCLKEIERLRVVTGIEFSSIDVSTFSNGDKTACNYLNLNLSVTHVNSRTIILNWNAFAVGANETVVGYLLYYIEDPMGNMTIYDESDDCGVYGWDSVFVSNNSKEIGDLLPFTQYAYYIKTYTSPPSIGGQTEIRYFTTLSDDPSIPLNIKGDAISSDGILLTWVRPEHTNGILNFYHLTVIAQEDDYGVALQRDFCHHPHVTFYTDHKSEKVTNLWTNSSANATCCNKENKYVDIFEDVCSLVDAHDSPFGGSCGKHDQLLTDANDDREVVKIDPNVTNYLVQRLHHFTSYIFYLKACNNESQCSASVMASNRTFKKIDADYIPSGLTAEVLKSDTVFKWPEPEEPNSIIVAYQLQYKRVDLENSKNVTECINHSSVRGGRYVIQHLPPGQYAVRVKPISLAGEGKYSESVRFVIELPDNDVSPVAIVVPVALVTFCIFGAIYYFYYYKRKRRLNSLHLITNVNPDYAGPIYIEDEWEIDRIDIEIMKELGHGTFGMVYSGFIKSKNMPCAVKTANSYTDYDDKMTFLNEASVMKSFSDAHHVVKLLGVVSKGQPPFVVMELMTRGDLKSFLRRSRDSSSSLTCAEMYRMAAEIADGMLYLAAKKFVHRDLAARNCMVAADFTVKIGDFGMTRDIYETDYYRKETRGLMPVRWMSPESLADGVFTSDSDIWSYGVVLWEMATLAEQPYQGLANEQVLQFVIAQGTLERPHECPDLLYEIMDACWKWKPIHRPLFKDIVEKLEQNIGQNFRLVSFFHSSEGEEYRLHCKDRVYNPPALTVPLGKSTAIHWKTSHDDVSIYSMDSQSSNPTPLLSSFENQSRNMPSGSSYR